MLQVEGVPGSVACGPVLGWNDLEGAATDRSTSIDPTWLEGAGAGASAGAGANMELSMLNMMDGHRVAEVEIGPWRFNFDHMCCHCSPKLANENIQDGS